MRHTHATLLLESGKGIKHVAERLETARTRPLETYAHVTPRMRSSAVGKVRGFFGPAGALVGEADVAMPLVETGGEGDCDPPVTPRASHEASEGRGGA